jgi:hypothetical protein
MLGRWLDAFKYGASMDYQYHSSSSSSRKETSQAAATSPSATSSPPAKAAEAGANHPVADGSDLGPLPGFDEADALVAAAKASAWGTTPLRSNGQPLQERVGVPVHLARPAADEEFEAVAAAATAAATMEPNWHYHQLPQQKQQATGEGGARGHGDDLGFQRLR